MTTSVRPQLSSLCAGAPGPRDRELSAMCHALCHGNTEVRTSYGEVALTLRCGCECHQQPRADL